MIKCNILPRDAGTSKRAIATLRCLSVCRSVCLSDFVTLKSCNLINLYYLHDSNV